MNGINVKYSLNPNYFKVGQAYSMRIETNQFRIGILTDYNEDSITFKLFEKGDFVDFTLTVNQLLYDDYCLVKLEPDYGKGKFSNKSI